MPILGKKSTKSEKKDLDHGHTNHQAALISSEDLKIMKYLGEGCYGLVELGEWKTSSGEPKYVAIKSIKATVHDGVLRDVLQEASTMQKLSHDNIVKFYGISLSPGEEQLKLITEFAPYGSLEGNFSNKNKNVLLVSTLCKFASQVANGMNYLTSQQLVHRDLATRNILLFEKDLVKISDFGLARTLGDDGAQEVSLDSQLAIAWMPPETIEKRLFTPASDVWSYGIMLWEMFSFGQKPWGEFSTSQVKGIVANDSNKRLEKPLACPDGFYELIMLKSWEKDPNDRPTFKSIVKGIIPKLQPKEGTTNVRHKTTAEGYLSFGNKEKVTIISRVDDGMLLAQTENCCMGLIDVKHVKTCASNHVQITRPYEVKKRDRRQVVDELRKIAGLEAEERRKDVPMPLNQGEQNNDNTLLKLAEDEVIVDPNFTLYPDPYPAMADWRTVGATEPGATGRDSSEYVPMATGTELDEDNYESMDHEYSTLKVRGTSDISGKQPGLPYARHGRALSESDVSEHDPHYDRLWQATTGSKDDSSVQPNRKGKKIPPPVPSRLDIIGENNGTLAEEATSDVSGQDTGLSPKGTIPKKRPIPTPRRKTMQKPRPTSDGFLGSSFSCNDAEAITRCNSASSVEKVPPEVPLPHKSAESVTDFISDKGDPATALNSANEHSEKHSEAKYSGGNQLTPDERLVQMSQADLAAKSSRDTSSCDNSSVDLIDLSTDEDSCPPLPPKKHAPAPHPGKPRYAKPTSLPLFPDIPPEVINQPPPPPEDLFGGHSFVPGFHSTETNNLHYGVAPIFDNDKPTTKHVEPIIRPSDPEHADDGSYGEEIDAGIHKIQDVCGKDVSRDWCYAALLQYQGDIEEVVRVIKVQKLANVTAKTEELCKRTLTHCNWDLNRAAAYIVDNFGDGDI